MEEKGKEDGWGEERKRYMWRCGMGTEEVERIRAAGDTIENKVTERDREVQIQERMERIWKSRSVPRYKELRVVGIPRYTKGKRRKKGKEVKIMARLRCGNEERGNKFWLKEEKRVCRMCRVEEETLEHLVGRCREMEDVEGCLEDILGEEGKGIQWGRKLKERRDRVEKKEREEWETNKE